MQITIEAWDSSLKIRGDIEEDWCFPGSEFVDDFCPVLATSDGTLLKIAFDEDGHATFERISVGQCVLIMEDKDRIILEGDIRWIVSASSYTVSKTK